MTLILLIPTVLSLLVLAAHFARSASYPLVAVSLALILLVFVRRPWAARALQIVLLLAAVEWVFTAVNIVQARQSMGRASGRAVMIVMAVAAVNVIAAFLYRTSPLARRYRLVSPPDEPAKTSVQGV